MAQTILTVYAGDQIFKLVASGIFVPRSYLRCNSFVIRIGGTLLGLIMAILIWYIGRHADLICRVLCYSPVIQGMVAETATHMGSPPATRCS